MMKGIKREIKLLLLKLVLLSFGPLRERERYGGTPRSIIIIAQEKIGDAILLTPLLKNLRRGLPHARIDVVAVGANSRFFDGDPNVDRVYRLKSNYFSYCRSMRREEYDLLFSPKDHASFTFLIQSRFIKAGYRVGIDHPKHRGFFDHMIEIDFSRHIIEKNCSLLDFLEIPYEDEETRPYLPVQEISDELGSFLSQIDDKEIVAVNLSAGEKKREWPLKMWIDLIDRLKFPVIVLSMSDRLEEKRMLEETMESVMPSPVTRTIYEAGELIRRVKLLITPDTSLVHVASCYGTPVVGLYAADPDQIKRFYPYRTSNQILISPTDRVQDIVVDQVDEAAGKMMGGCI